MRYKGPRLGHDLAHRTTVLTSKHPNLTPTGPRGTNETASKWNWISFDYSYNIATLASEPGLARWLSRGYERELGWTRSTAYSLGCNPESLLDANSARVTLQKIARQLSGNVRLMKTPDWSINVILLPAQPGKTRQRTESRDFPSLPETHFASGKVDLM